MDCCERTSGLYYESIDCYDDNTPIILSTAQNYLFTPDNFCTHPTNCDYSSQSITESESNLCLIAWALLQQYYNKCPQLVMGTTNIEKTHFDLSPANTFTTTDVIDYDSAPKLINPLVYKTFIDNEVSLSVLSYPCTLWVLLGNITNICIIYRIVCNVMANI